MVPAFHPASHSSGASWGGLEAKVRDLPKMAGGAQEDRNRGGYEWAEQPPKSVTGGGTQRATPNTLNYPYA